MKKCISNSLCTGIMAALWTLSLILCGVVAAQAHSAEQAQNFGFDLNSARMGSGSPLGEARVPHFKGPRLPHVKARKGLAVIADFADAQLEHWQGDGINNESELASQLAKMENHWSWLSHERETFQWDIIRITLPVNLGPEAYTSWVDYRNAVGALIREQVNVSQYDSNQDGVVDSAWIIASNNGMAYDYLVGGASSNAGVNMFVDGQNSLSVVVGATGNFNHETGHPLGLPDLYGPYGTLSYLTVMADSWALPPQDFTAYERSLLGWLTPRMLGEGRHRAVRLPAADQHMRAVKIPTARVSEYFLIEYRQRPDSGYGSRAPDYDGLAVYHVLETSAQWTDPPLLKLEPADGSIVPDTAPEITDFVYPQNPSMQLPLILRSYYSGNEVFRINAVHRSGGNAMKFDVTVAPPTMVDTNNLLQNPSFEQGSGADPHAWQPEAFELSAQFVWVDGVSHQGQHSVSIATSTPNDARWIQTANGLTPGHSYELCGWIRGENITTGPEAKVGANVSVMGGFVGSKSLASSFDWTQACVSFAPETSSATVACRLGFYGSIVTGTAWCDDLSLVPLNSAFSDIGQNESSK
jgi:hypothetical protein